ncbi:MAG: integrin alpha, partial [Planctomycetota bacterium]
MIQIARGSLPVRTAVATVLVLAGAGLALARPAGAADDGWLSEASRRVRSIEYAFASQGGAWTAPNRAHNLRTQVSARGVLVTPRLPGEAAFELRLAFVSASASTAAVSAHDHRVEIERDGVVEWYENDERGLEQGFDVVTGSPSGKLTLTLALDTMLDRALDADGSRIAFFAHGVEVLQYRGLKAWDANHNVLAARLELDRDTVRIVVDDAGATYPVHVDPVLSGPSWSSESNQAGADFGWQVATAGDVNGDGFSDVIVGAPFFDNGESDEGAAFVFLGSLTGPSLAPAWSAESNQDGASLGWSVAPAGDVNGDGFADVLVGARQYDNDEVDEGGAFLFTGSGSGLGISAAWTAEGNQASCFFGISVATAGDVNGDGFDDVLVGASLYDNGEADEGRAFLFNGSAIGPSLAPDWTTEGDQVSALYGISVATAGDVNGDGFADLLVGAQGYDNGQLNEGRAFLFLGSAGGPPLTASWTAESDQASAQLGISVATAGDVNGDGFADVLVGAPTYDNGQTDEGRAFLYLGSLSGLSASPSWTSEADVAGAFHGYSVAAAGDVDGDGFADVVVGAPNYSNGETLEGHLSVYLGDAA